MYATSISHMYGLLDRKDTVQGMYLLRKSCYIHDLRMMQQYSQRLLPDYPAQAKIQTMMHNNY